MLSGGAPGALSSPSPNPVGTHASPSVQLQNQKLIQEIRQLQLSNQTAASPWHYLVILAPVLVAIAAILTFGLGWSTQRRDARRQSERDRDQREAESMRRFDASFAGVVTNLGSDSLSLRASAASTLALYLDTRYVEFRSHVLLVAAANLRLGGNEVIRDILIRVLGKALRQTYASYAPPSQEPVDVSDADLRGLNMSGAILPELFWAARANLSRSCMDSCDLWKSDLRETSLAGASLRRVNLGQARLDRADLTHARLRGSRATSASLREVDGRFAMLQGASLQSAHFEQADLRGARFDGANVADCYFYGAKLDAGALQSLFRSQNWRKAHFDPAVHEKLLNFATSGSQESADSPM